MNIKIEEQLVHQDVMALIQLDKQLRKRLSIALGWFPELGGAGEIEMLMVAGKRGLIGNPYAIAYAWSVIRRSCESGRFCNANQIEFASCLLEMAIQEHGAWGELESVGFITSYDSVLHRDLELALNELLERCDFLDSRWALGRDGVLDDVMGIPYRPLFADLLMAGLWLMPISGRKGDALGIGLYVQQGAFESVLHKLSSQVSFTYRMADHIICNQP